MGDVLDRLDVEPDGRDGRDDLAELELVQDRRLTWVGREGRMARVRYAGIKQHHAFDSGHLPAASSPTMRMRISCFPKKRSQSLANERPILQKTWRDGGAGRQILRRRCKAGTGGSCNPGAGAITRGAGSSARRGGFWGDWAGQGPNGPRLIPAGVKLACRARLVRVKQAVEACGGR